MLSPVENVTDSVKLLPSESNVLTVTVYSVLGFRGDNKALVSFSFVISCGSEPFVYVTSYDVTP